MSLWDLLLQRAGLIQTPPIKTQSEFRAREVIPDTISTEPIVGFRSWYVSRTLQGLRLMGFANHVWDAEETAECLPFTGPKCGGVVPNPHHTCGLYAETPDQPLEEWQSQLHGRVVASGTVRLSGTVVVCQMGYRAQYAAINDPVVLDMTCTGVIGPFGAASGCPNPPVRVSLEPFAPGRRNQIVAWCMDGTHVPSSPVKHTLEATPWIKEAAKELSDAYGLEFLTWSDL